MNNKQEGNVKDAEKLMEEKENEFLGLLEEMSKVLTEDDYKYMIEKFRGILRRSKWTKSGKYGR